MSNQVANSESIIKQIRCLIENFEAELLSKDLRKKILALIPIFQNLRELGKSLIPSTDASSARSRILHYLKKYPHTIIKGDELLVVSAIQDYPRRIRELRVQFGFSIISGVTAKEMAEIGEFPIDNIDVSFMKPDDYILLSDKEDREAAHRWFIANEIRKHKDSVRNKILEYFKHNVGIAITGEELRYVAKNKTEWARRVRELRTEYGWSIVTKNTGRPDLPVGNYILESLRQSPEHDRQIPDPIRGFVLRRDNYTCAKCGWSYRDWNQSDPRHLELHHMKEHVKGGENTEENLITVCTICHDEIHRKR
jgi:hypothetical protein